MKRILITTLSTLLFVLSAIAQENFYVINGKHVENFDGSQLVGKNIRHYDIKRLDSVIVHNIVTTDSTSTSHSDVTVQTWTNVSVATDSTAAPPSSPRTEAFRNPLIILDGEIFTGKLNDINQTSIKSMNVYKPNSDVAQSYGELGKNGVIEIFTKQQPDAITYFINGELANKEMFNSLSPSQIKTVKVLRRGSAAAMEASPDGKTNDIYLITTN